MKPLKIKLVVSKPSLGAFCIKYSVIDQPNGLKGKGLIFEDRGVSIISVNMPQLAIHNHSKTIDLYVRGESTHKNNNVWTEFVDNKSEVISALDKIYYTVLKYNKIIGQKGVAPEIIIEDSAKPFIF